MTEESQVRGCYNITFYLHQPGNSVGSPLNQMHRQQLELLLTTCYCRDTGERVRGGPSDDDELMLNVLRCQLTY